MARARDSEGVDAGTGEAGGSSTAAPVLSDGRTSLRRFTVADAPAFTAINHDPLNLMWAGSDATMDDNRSADFIAGHIAAGWESGSSLRFAVTEARTDDGDHACGHEVLGTVSLHEVFSTETGGSASIGIKMLPAGRGTGSAMRAIELLCGWAFGGLGLEILHWRCTSGNQGSLDLAQRCGFVMAAEIPGYGHKSAAVADGVILTLSAAQWNSRLRPEPLVPVLRGESVVLRALTMSDAAALVENCLDPEALRWTTVPPDYTLDHAEFFIRNLTPQGWRTGQTLTFAAADADTDCLLGTVDLQCKTPGTAAVGINIGPQWRGTGAAEAAVRLLLDYAFHQLNLSYVHWHALVPNWASRKLAWRLGFHFDGEIRGDYDDRGTPRNRWILSLAAGEPQSPQEPWTGPAPVSR